MTEKLEDMDELRRQVDEAKKLLEGAKTPEERDRRLAELTAKLGETTKRVQANAKELTAKRTGLDTRKKNLGKAQGWMQILATVGIAFAGILMYKNPENAAGEAGGIARAERAAREATAAITNAPRRSIELDDKGVYKTVIYAAQGSSLGGPNGPDVIWAVFFYRPYCGACRRIKPFFEALADATDAPDKLRFGVVDCVRYRAICSREGVDAPPVIRMCVAGSRRRAESRVRNVPRADCSTRRLVVRSMRRPAADGVAVVGRGRGSGRSSLARRLATRCEPLPFLN